MRASKVVTLSFRQESLDWTTKIKQSHLTCLDVSQDNWGQCKILISEESLQMAVLKVLVIS